MPIAAGEQRRARSPLCCDFGCYSEWQSMDPATKTNGIPLIPLYQDTPHADATGAAPLQSRLVENGSTLKTQVESVSSLVSAIDGIIVCLDCTEEVFDPRSARDGEHDRGQAHEDELSDRGSQSKQRSTICRLRGHATRCVEQHDDGQHCGQYPKDRIAPRSDPERENDADPHHHHHGLGTDRGRGPLGHERTQKSQENHSGDGEQSPHDPPVGDVWPASILPDWREPPCH